MRSCLFLALVLCACSVDEYGSTPNTPGDGKQPDSPTGGPGGGMLQISAMASPLTPPGQYSPLNIDAIWIEGPSGFIKTLGRWAGTRKQHLVAWTMAAGAGDADAVSGATRQNYNAALTATYNLVDKQGQVLPDGMYTIRMESTELNATTATQNHQGTFTFMKSAAPQTQSDLSSGGFTAVSITFTPL